MKLPQTQERIFLGNCLNQEELRTHVAEGYLHVTQNIVIEARESHKISLLQYELYIPIEHRIQTAK